MEKPPPLRQERSLALEFSRLKTTAVRFEFLRSGFRA
jgi:hypothetical protein